LQKLDGDEVIAAVAKYLLILLICPASPGLCKDLGVILETQDILEKDGVLFQVME
jgi:hypothetical protein